jgi:hypothetical protein
MSEADESRLDSSQLNQVIEAGDLLHSSGSLVLVTGRLYREVQVKHPRNARFTLQNERGLFFVKVYQAALVTVAQSFKPGTDLLVLGEMHSFVSRRCQNHHVFIKAEKIFPLTEPLEGWTVRIEKGADGVIIGQ